MADAVFNWAATACMLVILLMRNELLGRNSDFVGVRLGG